MTHARSAELPDLPGVISAPEVVETAEAIAALQLPSGMIPWFPGGHCDPWNHVETAMALSVAGLIEPAERAYYWLLGHQRSDGSWHNYYLADRVKDAKLDTNCVAYVATGVWHHWLLTGDRGFLETMWPVVDRAVEFVLSMQTRRGEIIWARHTDGTPWSYALLTGSSSIAHSLDCAVKVAAAHGVERPDWELAAVRLADVIRTQPEAFAPKDRWAMDWYYPVLAGVVTGGQGRERLASRWDTFVMEGLGVRCVSNQPWVTAAETAECALAHLIAGNRVTAFELLSWTRPHRADDGSYWTGIVYPERSYFPAEERTAYTSAAIILTADAYTGTSSASSVFLPELDAVDDPKAD